MESKSNNWIFFSLVVCALGMATGSCKRAEIPVIITIDTEDITDVTVLCGGIISSDGGAEITACGVCWSTDSTKLFIENAAHTSDNIEMGGFRSSITNLTPVTEYYVRAYAANKAGTAYGQTISFTATHYVSQINFNPSVDYGNLIDQDGNSYKTVTIGSQTWMAENLKAITLNDGTPLLDSYCWYNYDVTSNKADYGALYSWGSLTSGKLCPAGWHVPSMDEWQVLINYLGGSDVAGGKLKETGIKHWLSPNTYATNETGFTALPGGRRYINYGNFLDAGKYGFWWSSTAFDASDAWNRQLGTDICIYQNFDNKGIGFSVRCVRD